MTGELSDEVLRALRRIIRATVAYSHRLASEFGLTVPQLVVLREIAARGEASGSDLARAVSVSPATMTGILKRLRERGLVERRRSRQDRRRILESLTDEGRDILA
ncbi:MAG: MarR family transcriptional regulator, partial [Longimicrobiales bacterium]|nr:MarR family transcriptional regulator [Longimicrobiales bacterium]